MRDATLEDVEPITQLWYNSFNKSHKFWTFATPDNEETRAWLNQVWVMGISAGSTVTRTLVVEDLNRDKRLVAFCRIHVPQMDGNQNTPMPPMPSGWDPELADALWGGTARNRAKIMGKRLHWMGEFLGVDPSYQDKGVASALLEWGCSQADATGLEVYLEATPKGLPLYKKHFGFKEVKPFDLPQRPDSYGSYDMIVMVRQPRNPLRSLL